MPRHGVGANGLINGPCKIRKRGCSTSSSASSLLKNYRFKRAILVGKRCGSTTPVPMWKMNAGSPSSTTGLSESSQYQPSMQTSVSARKLATALWEMNRIPSPQMTEDLPDQRSKKNTKGRCRMVRSTQPGSLPQRLSDLSHSPVSEISDRSRSSSHTRIMPPIYHKSQYNGYNLRASDLPSNTSLMETETHSQVLTPMSSVIGAKSHLKDLSNGLTASKRLLKILVRVWGRGEQHKPNIALVSALHAELDQVHVLVDKFIQEQRSDHGEISCINKHSLEERSAWKSKEQERIRGAVRSLMEELESEKKLRRREEMMNKKLGMELAHAKISLSKAVKELESERRSREIIEEVCNELVRGIGEEKAEVEELKSESVKVREELEKEREMLQLADEWREERVQMKLSEAKFQFEEKNAAVDQLRNELEAFLAAKRTEEPRSACKYLVSNVDDKDLSQLVFPNGSCRATNLTVDRRKENGQGQEEEDEVDLEDSDFHSIELNTNNSNKSYIWSHAGAATEDDANIDALEGKHEIRSANCERAQSSSLSLDRSAIEGPKRNFSNKFLLLGDVLDQEKLCDNSSLLDKQAQRMDQDAERYLSVKGLRDHLLSNSIIAMPRGLACPTRRLWSRAQALEDTGDQACEGSMVDEMVKAIRESGLKVKSARNSSKVVRSQVQMAPVQ